MMSGWLVSNAMRGETPSSATEASTICPGAVRSRTNHLRLGEGAKRSDCQPSASASGGEGVKL